MKTTILRVLMSLMAVPLVSAPASPESSWETELLRSPAHMFFQAPDQETNTDFDEAVDAGFQALSEKAFREAERQFGKALELAQSDHEKVVVNYGMLQLTHALERFDECVTHAQFIIDHVEVSDSADTYYYYAYLYLHSALRQLEREDEAKQAAEEVQRIRNAHSKGQWLEDDASEVLVNVPNRVGLPEVVGHFRRGKQNSKSFRANEFEVKYSTSMNVPESVGSIVGSFSIGLGTYGDLEAHLKKVVARSRADKEIPFLAIHDPIDVSFSQKGVEIRAWMFSTEIKMFGRETFTRRYMMETPTSAITITITGGRKQKEVAGKAISDLVRAIDWVAEIPEGKAS